MKEKRIPETLPAMRKQKFGLTVEDVVDERHNAEIQTAKFRQAVENCSDDDRNKSSYMESKVTWDEWEKALSALPPDQILARCKTLYERAMTLAESVSTMDAWTKQLATEFPDYDRLYFGVLQRTIWGSIVSSGIRRWQP